MKRGDRPAEEITTVLEEASTGPRFMKRGDRSPPPRLRPRLQSFNGAALHEARRFHQSAQRNRKNSSFNGAALHEARRYIPAPSSSAASKKLQRGRAS